MKRKSENVLSYMINLLKQYMEDLADVKDTPSAQFAYGEKTAYTECLEILATWEDAAGYDLAENIEELYPL